MTLTTIQRNMPSRIKNHRVQSRYTSILAFGPIVNVISEHLQPIRGGSDGVILLRSSEAIPTEQQSNLVNTLR